MKMKRIGAWLLCVMLAVGLFSFAVHLAGHECEEEHCCVCETIALLGIICLAFPAVCMLHALLRRRTQAYAFTVSPAAVPTLVSLKIRLDN